MTDESGRPFAGVYRASDASPTLFALRTTDRGDVRELADTSGAAFALYSYDAYGNALETTSAATPSVGTTLAADIASRQVLRYAGYAFDAYSGLYYCSARYFDSKTFAFISKDPVRADGEESAYQYCGGDPVGKVDPSGLWWWETTWCLHVKGSLNRYNALLFAVGAMPAVAVAAAKGVFGGVSVGPVAAAAAVPVLVGVGIASVTLPGYAGIPLIAAWTIPFGVAWLRCRRRQNPQ